MDRLYRCRIVGEHTKAGSSFSKKKYAIPCGVSMSDKTDSSVTRDNTSRRNSSLFSSKQIGVGLCVGYGVAVGIGSVGDGLGCRVRGRFVGSGVSSGARVGCGVTVGEDVGLGDSVGSGEIVGAVGSDVGDGEGLGDVVGVDGSVVGSSGGLVGIGSRVGNVGSLEGIEGDGSLVGGVGVGNRVLVGRGV